jgi:hypothetical protein
MKNNFDELNFSHRKYHAGIIFSRPVFIISLLKTLIMARGKTGRGTRSNNHGDRQNTSNRGFAAMDPEKQRKIASKGGRSSHRGGRSRSSGR